MANEPNVPNTAEVERKGLQASEVNPAFRLTRLADGSLAYDRIASGRDWSSEAVRIGTCDHIGPFAQVRRSMLGGQNAAALYGDSVLFESEDGHYALFVPLNLLKPLFAHRWVMSSKKSASLGVGASMATPGAAADRDPIEMELLESTRGAGAGLKARPSLSQLRSLLGDEFADLSPFFARADMGSLFGPAAGRPDLNFLRQAQAAVATMPGGVAAVAERVVPAGQPRFAPYKLEPGAELLVSTEPGRAEVVLQKPPQMPPGKVSVPFYFSGAGHLQYDASAPLDGSVKMGDGRPFIDGEHPSAHNVTLTMTAPRGLRRADGPHGPWDVRNAVDILAAPLEVSSWNMYVGAASRAGAPSAMRTTWSGSEDRVVFDGDRYVPVADVQRRARGAHSRSDYCPLNYVLGEDELLLDGMNVTSVLGGKGRFRDVSPHGGTHASGLGLGAHGHFLSESSPEAAIVKTVKEIAVERRRRAGAYKGSGSWGAESAKLDTPESFDEKTGKKKDEKEIKRDTGVAAAAPPPRRELDGRREARDAKPIGGWILERPVAMPEVYYNVQYMLPTQVPLRPYDTAGGEGAERAKWEAWAGAGPEAVHLTRSSREPGGKYSKATDVSRPEGAAGTRRPGARRPEAAMRADEAAAGEDGLFGRPGVHGGGSLAGGFSRPEAQFLVKGLQGMGGFGTGAGTSGASALLGVEGAAASSMAGLGFAGSFAGAGLGIGGAFDGSAKVRAFPMSTARSDLSVLAGGAGGEPLMRYRAPELTALRSTLQGAGYDLSSPPPRTSLEGFEATSHKRGLFAGGSMEGVGSDGLLGASRAHVTGGGSSRMVNLDPKSDLGFMPRGTESVGRFGGVTGGVAPSAAFGEPGMDLVGGASGLSRTLMASGGGAMALGFGGAAVAAGTSDSGESAKAPAPKKSDTRSRGGESSLSGQGGFAFSGGGSGEGKGDQRSLYLDYSPSDRTLYVSRFGKGGPDRDRPDFGVHLPTGLHGAIKLSGTTREYAHTAKSDRSVPGGDAASGGAGMAKGWTGGAGGGGVTLGGAPGAGGAGLDAARMGLASGAGKAPGADGGAPPLSSDTMVKFLGPALSYQLGHDEEGNNVLLYNGKMNASASGYPGADEGLEFALPLGMERYSQDMVGEGLDGDLHVSWGGKEKKPGDLSDLHPLTGSRKPSVYNFPMSASFSGGIISGVFGSGIAGGKAQGLAGKAREGGLEPSGHWAYRGAIDGSISGRGPVLSAAQFEGEVADTARAVSKGLAGDAVPGGFGGGLGGGFGGGLGGGFGGMDFARLGSIAGGNLLSGGGPTSGLPGMPGLPGAGMAAGPDAAGPGAPGAAPGMVVPSGGLDAIRGKSANFSTSVSLADLSSKGPSYGIRREDLVGMQKAFSSGGPGGGSYSMKAPGVDLVIVRPTTGKGDVSAPDSVIMNGKRVEAYTKSSMKNPASASTENKVNLDYEMIAREIYKRIKNLAALQRERRADDHMRYG